MAAVIVPFKPGHALAIQRRDADRLATAGVDREEWARRCANAGPAWTMASDGQIVACMGVALFWSGTGEVWAVTSGLVETLRLAFYRMSKQGIAALQDQAGGLRLRRVQATVPVWHQRSRLWVEALGFQPEGTLRLYGPDGSDFIMYARTRNA